jgi:peptidoglycan-associated lipoprotein
MNRPLAFLSLGAAALSLAACAAKPPKALPPPPQAPATDSARLNPGAPVPGSQADFIAAIASDTIHFDTDKSDIDGTSQQILADQARWLAKYPGKRVTLEGHCDERGTRDYNLALGERRANSAKTALVALGVDAGRITTVSYGKERPVAPGSDAESWARNRREVTVTVQN